MHNTPPAILRLVFRSSQALAASAMPFLQHQGLFIPSARPVDMGQRFFIVLQSDAVDVPEAAGLATVCWITPEACSDGRSRGFGVHFDPSATALRQMLAEALAQVPEARQIVSHTL